MIDLKGHIKVSGTMDQNTFTLTNSADQYVGELVITEANIYNELVKCFTDYGKAHGISKETFYISPNIKLPIQLTIKIR
jgi:hypothetical protein